MIGYLSGTVFHTSEKTLILLVQGVGYEIRISPSVSTQKGKEINLFIYTLVREQEITLYGFSSETEKKLFLHLISVSGIGPKSALEFFTFPVSHIQNAISNGDIEFLTSVKGIGKKTAERIVIELKNTFGYLGNLSDLDQDGNMTTEIIETLIALGYLRQDIMQTLKNAPEFSSAEKGVEWFLKQI
jgi:Holliday junction DNA helicase RuvA